jgi:DivIVA domain-containing protein
VLTVLAILGVLVVLFLAGALATREDAALAPAVRDAADVDLPTEGPVRGADLRRVRFGLALRGYRMSEVDAVLARLSAELDDRDRRLGELGSQEGPGDSPALVPPAASLPAQEPVSLDKGGPAA